MTLVKTSYNRRSFLRTSALAGGGLMIGFSWLASCKPTPEQIIDMPKEWFEINGYLKIGDNGMVTIMSPNPEIGQNVKTSMPMIVAEELDIDWKDVIVEQAALNTTIFKRQLAGGSQSIRHGWEALRMAGATGRYMLVAAAAEQWQVPAEEITTDAGKLFHKASDRTLGYGEVASAAAKLTAPEEVSLKEVKDFKIIGTSRKNVDGKNIVTGKPLFGIDIQKEGMLIAMIAHPPAFGMKLKSFDATEAKSMPGITSVFEMKTFNEDYTMSAFDITAFQDLVVVVGKTTWEVMNAKKALKIVWEPTPDIKAKMDMFGNTMDIHFPAGLENSTAHTNEMVQQSKIKQTVVRKDGNPDEIFKTAFKVIERSYSCPFLAHNCMEPMNFFADVTDDMAVLNGPIQTPEFMEKSVAARLGMHL
jgi:isoquinoline 1-oxidoreductase beta subunit